MNLTNYLKRKIRPYYLELIRQGNIRDFAHRSIYASKFEEWSNKHICKRFYGGYEARYQMYEFLSESENLMNPINYLEFGVYQGESMRWWAKKNEHPDSRFMGFDSFQGLPEDWNGLKPQTSFSTNGKIPRIEDERCSFQVGWFQDTLPKFVANFAFDKPTIIHLDADLYSSTLFVLITIAPKLKEGDILIFDEFYDWMHEFRAFLDFISCFQIEYEVIAAVENFRKVTLKIRRTPSL